VQTPGTNKKRYLAGALHSSMRQLTWVEGKSKASSLFIQLLWRLRGEYRKAKWLHLILDNASIHSSKKTLQALEQLGGRVVLHFLPPYCPQANRSERLWLDVHANVTRSHRCRTIEKLMRQLPSAPRRLTACENRGRWFSSQSPERRGPSQQESCSGP
jgi:transposase